MTTPIQLFPGIQNQFDLLCLDTEFSRLPLPDESIRVWSSHALLLSVGIAPMDALDVEESFYAVRAVDERVLARCSAFVKSQVLVHLDASPALGTYRSMTELQRLLAPYLLGRRHKTGKAPLLVADWQGDTVLLEDAVKPPAETLLLEDFPEIEAALQQLVVRGLFRHNALHDAMALREGIRAHLLAAAA